MASESSLNGLFVEILMSVTKSLWILFAMYLVRYLGRPSATKGSIVKKSASILSLLLLFSSFSYAGTLSGADSTSLQSLSDKILSLKSFSIETGEYNGVCGEEATKRNVYRNSTRLKEENFIVLVGNDDCATPANFNLVAALPSETDPNGSLRIALGVGQGIIPGLFSSRPSDAEKFRVQAYKVVDAKCVLLKYAPNQSGFAQSKFGELTCALDASSWIKFEVSPSF